MEAPAFLATKTASTQAIGIAVEQLINPSLVNQVMTSPFIQEFQIRPMCYFVAKAFDALSLAAFAWMWVAPAPPQMVGQESLGP